MKWEPNPSTSRLSRLSRAAILRSRVLFSQTCRPSQSCCAKWFFRSLLSTMPLRQALNGRRENTPIERGTIGPSSEVSDVVGSESRSETGAGMRAIRRREHTQREVHTD
jgi:hypothetical protein